jgi:hypothetical protein
VKPLLLNVSTIVSLLLCVTTAALWAHSYFAADGLSRTRFIYTDPLQADGTIPQDHYFTTTLVSRRGLAWLSRFDMTQDASGMPDGEDAFSRPVHLFSDPDSGLRPHDSPRWRWLGFWYAADTYRCEYGIPTGALVPATALLPLARWWRRLRRRVSPGCCHTCGYDLRATALRCPECGAIPTR